jgi:hypothetical protein
MRHKTLIETNEDLRAIAQTNSANIEKEQLHQSDLVKSHNDNMLTYNSQLSNCQKKLEKLKTLTGTLEQRIDQKNQSSMLKLRALGETMLAIENLHVRVLGSFVFLAQLKAGLNQPGLQQQQNQQNQHGQHPPGTQGSGSGVSGSNLSMARKNGQRPPSSTTQTSEASGASGRNNLATASTHLTAPSQMLALPGNGSDAGNTALPNASAGPILPEITMVQQQHLPHHHGILTVHMPAAATRAALPWQEKVVQIQNRVIDLAEIVDKAQEFIAAEKTKRAEIDKMRQEIYGAIAKEEKQREKEIAERRERRRQGQQQQQQSSQTSSSQSSRSMIQAMQSGASIAISGSTASSTRSIPVGPGNRSVMGSNYLGSVNTVRSNHLQRSNSSILATGAR